MPEREREGRKEKPRGISYGGVYHMLEKEFELPRKRSTDLLRIGGADRRLDRRGGAGFEIRE